jgi:hypothetical protein
MGIGRAPFINTDISLMPSSISKNVLVGFNAKKFMPELAFIFAGNKNNNANFNSNNGKPLNRPSPQAPSTNRRPNDWDVFWNPKQRLWTFTVGQLYAVSLDAFREDLKYLGTSKIRPKGYIPYSSTIFGPLMVTALFYDGYAAYQTDRRKFGKESAKFIGRTAGGFIGAAIGTSLGRGFAGTWLGGVLGANMGEGLALALSE